jgi:5-methylcytosine-specific restriction endonuclease McrA
VSLRRPVVTLPFEGRVDPATGRNLCVWCGVAVQGRRVCWCSDTCVQDYKLAKGDQGAARRVVWKLHRGVCQICRVDVNKRRREILAEHGYMKSREFHDQTRWEADHIVPIVEGGKLDRTNLRTLCRACHKQVTRELRARLAAKRRQSDERVRLRQSSPGRPTRAAPVAPGRSTPAVRPAGAHALQARRRTSGA